jgi:hypothetical protein
LRGSAKDPTVAFQSVGVFPNSRLYRILTLEDASLRTRARVNQALEQYEDAVRDFKASLEAAPSGSADEAGLKKELRQAEIDLKRVRVILYLYLPVNLSKY